MNVKGQCLIPLIILSLLPIISVAENDALEKLMSAKSLVCDFPVGTFADWQGTTLKLDNDQMKGQFHFDNINLKNKSARLIGNLGAVDVMVFASPGGLTFMEATGIGNMIYTTVFPSYLGQKTIPGASEPDLIIKNQLPKAFMAVMSRHLFDPVITHLPMPSQFHGYCRALE
jgi:hypothetical protein